MVVKRVPPPILADGALRQKMVVRVSPQVHTNAKVLYRADRNKFSKPAPAIRLTPAHKAVLKTMRIVPASYYYRRNVFYTHYQYVPPAYVYNLKPRYGIWDTTFLAFMMDRIYEPQYALMYYHHRNEAEFLEWRSEMDRLAMNNNELGQNLAAMDQQMAQLEGVPVDPAYFAEDASDIAVSADIIEQLDQA